jgi:hypothetical protein
MVIEIEGEKYTVSDHARKRFHERYESNASDQRIILTTKDYSKAIWRKGGPEHPYSMGVNVLVTVLPIETPFDEKMWQRNLRSMNAANQILATL